MVHACMRTLEQERRSTLEHCGGGDACMLGMCLPLGLVGSACTVDW